MKPAHFSFSQGRVADMVPAGSGRDASALNTSGHAYKLNTSLPCLSAFGKCPLGTVLPSSSRAFADCIGQVLQRNRTNTMYMYMCVCGCVFIYLVIIGIDSCGYGAEISCNLPSVS